MKLLRSPRWISGLAVSVVAIAVFVSLGMWQLSRLDERQTLNDTRTARAQLAPVPLRALLEEADGDVDSMVWRRVTVRGAYVAEEEVLLEGRSHRAAAGSNVLTPLQWDPGRAVVVNRGWIPISTDSASVAPIERDVVVAGVVRASEGAGLLGGSGEATDRLGSIDLDRLDTQTADVLLPVYVQLEAQLPSQAQPEPIPLPDLGDGPHLGYAVQWFFFALVVAVGFPVLVWRTTRSVSPSMPSSVPSAPRDHRAT